MKIVTIVAGTLTACIAGAGFAQQPEWTPRDPGYADSAPNSVCPRAEMRTVVDAYSAALAAHDAARVPLSANVRFTENGVEQRPGDSTMWKGAGQWRMQNNLIDTERCGTLSWGVIEEDGRLVHFAVRLQTLDGGEITEIEHIVGREEEFAYGPDGALESAWIEWDKILNPLHRQSRNAMIAAANDYFSMFVETPSVNPPFASRCMRWENGAMTTPELDCSPYGTELYMTQSQRRSPLVDIEAGIVAGFVFFNNGLPDVHVFDMHRGEIQFIQAVVGPRAPDGGWLDAAAADRGAEGPNR